MKAENAPTPLKLEGKSLEQFRTLEAKIPQWETALAHYHESLRPLEKLKSMAARLLDSLARARGIWGDRLAPGHGADTLDGRVDEAIAIAKKHGVTDILEQFEHYKKEAARMRAVVIPAGQAVESLKNEICDLGKEVAIAAVEALRLRKAELSEPAIVALEALKTPKWKAEQLLDESVRIRELNHALSKMERLTWNLNNVGQATIVTSYVSHGA